MSRENFKIKAERKYGKSLSDVLKNFADRGLNYNDLANETGFTTTTVHKWCRKYKTTLDCYMSKIADDEDYYLFSKGFKDSTINKVNFLSKGWRSEKNPHFNDDFELNAVA